MGSGASLIHTFVAYYRVSTDKQGQSGLGLDAQRAAVELHARSVGAEVIAEFQDVESGRKADRVGLAAAGAACRLGTPGPGGGGAGGCGRHCC